MNLLIVIDMQNDFVSGALGSMQARDIVDKVVDKVKNWDGAVLFTRDTHSQQYLDTLEGKKLPVAHCIQDTDGWQIIDQLSQYATTIIDKPTFGSIELAQVVLSITKNITNSEQLERITLVGLCTDICVISNALLLRATLPNMPITVDSSCCAGVTAESHDNALKAMQMCHIDII